MKTILEWLNEAKEQGYEWADAAISNYDPKFMPIRKTNSLIASLETAFVWGGSPEGYDYWRNVRESLRPAEEEETPALETLIQELGELNNALRNIAYNDTLKEPYRTQIYDATKASYEEQLAEIKTEIAKKIGIEPPDVKQIMEELSSVKREFEAHKATAEELNRSYINEHNENYERMMKIEQLEKEIEVLKNRKLIGWVAQRENGTYSKCSPPFFMKYLGAWVMGRKMWSNITPEQAAALCDRLPQWTDDEPTPIYQ